MLPPRSVARHSQPPVISFPPASVCTNATRSCPDPMRSSSLSWTDTSSCMLRRRCQPLTATQTMKAIIPNRPNIMKTSGPTTLSLLSPISSVKTSGDPVWLTRRPNARTEMVRPAGGCVEPKEVSTRCPERVPGRTDGLSIELVDRRLGVTQAEISVHVRRKPGPFTGRRSTCGARAPAPCAPLRSRRGVSRRARTRRTPLQGRRGSPRAPVSRASRARAPRRR